jgi:hypothetical protein
VQGSQIYGSFSKPIGTHRQNLFMAGKIVVGGKIREILFRNKNYRKTEDRRLLYYKNGVVSCLEGKNDGDGAKAVAPLVQLTHQESAFLQFQIQGRTCQYPYKYSCPPPAPNVTDI